nr:class I SAM-dependent methyltransferase [Mycobacterium gordonae]
MSIQARLNAIRPQGVGKPWHGWYVGDEFTRIKAVKQALNARQNPVYLEIGVCRGYALRRIWADEKIAVDPEFKLSARSRRLAAEKARATHYFEMSSDAFFENEKAFLTQRQLDVALIDGLHTYPQVVRDVENTLRYLREDGVIILHDCNPVYEHIGRPAESHSDFRAHARWWQWLWSGDVWKAIVHLRSTRDDLRVAVLNCDFGVGVLRKGKPESRLSYSAAEVEALDYSDLVADRERLLNLKHFSYLDEFLASAAEPSHSGPRARGIRTRGVKFRRTAR